MTENVNPIDQAIQAAQQQAAENPVAQVETAPTAPTAVAVMPAAAPMSLASMVQETTIVDTYIKVKEAGLVLASAPTKYAETVDVIIDCPKISPAQVVKFGNPAVYLKTFDNVTCSTGGTWQDALAKAQSVNAGARPYRSVDLAMELVEDFKDMKGTVVAKAGTIVGHSTSTTNWNNFAGLFDKVMVEGGENGKVKVKLGVEHRTTKDYEWDILTFKLLEVLK